MTDQELLCAISDLMDQKLLGVDRKIDSLSDSVDKRFEAMDQKIDRLSDSVDKRFETMDQRLQSVDDRLKRIELTQENDILPRLQNIEECYVSTYKRYQSGAEQIDAMQSDIDVIKQVISEHSGKLQKLA